MKIIDYVRVSDAKENELFLETADILGYVVILRHDDFSQSYPFFYNVYVDRMGCMKAFHCFMNDDDIKDNQLVMNVDEFCYSNRGRVAAKKFGQ